MHFLGLLDLQWLLLLLLTLFLYLLLLLLPLPLLLLTLLIYLLHLYLVILLSCPLLLFLLLFFPASTAWTFICYVLSLALAKVNLRCCLTNPCAPLQAED